MKLFERYLLIACFWSLAWGGLNLFNPNLSMSFWGWTMFLVLHIPLIGLGAYLGRLFRDFTAPDMFLSSGAADTFKQKIFWSIGPQTIGGCIGLFVALAIVVQLFVN